MSNAPKHLAVVGATGIIGREVVSALFDRDVEPEALHLFATERSSSEELEFGEETLPVEVLDAQGLRGMRAVVVAVPLEAARGVLDAAAKHGAWIIDVTGTSRLDVAAPLLALDVNEGVLDKPFTGRTVAIASPATLALTAALEPLRRAFGLLEVEVTVLVGASRYGAAGIRLLEQQTSQLMGGRDVERGVFPHRGAFNVIPQVGDFDGPFAHDERALLLEVGRIWGAEAPRLFPTVLQVPTFHGMTLSLTARLKRPVDGEGVRAALEGADGLKLLDAPTDRLYPMPMLAVPDTAVLVGRIRASGDRVQLVAAVDGAGRAGAAAAQVASVLVGRE